jgi:hypothetical protein
MTTKWEVAWENSALGGFVSAVGWIIAAAFEMTPSLLPESVRRVGRRSRTGKWLLSTPEETVTLDLHRTVILGPLFRLLDSHVPMLRRACRKAATVRSLRLVALSLRRRPIRWLVVTAATAVLLDAATRLSSGAISSERLGMYCLIEAGAVTIALLGHATGDRGRGWLRSRLHRALVSSRDDP